MKRARPVMPFAFHISGRPLGVPCQLLQMGEESGDGHQNKAWFQAMAMAQYLCGLSCSPEA